MHELGDRGRVVRAGDVKRRAVGRVRLCDVRTASHAKGHDGHGTSV